MFGAGGGTWSRALRKQGERPRIEQKAGKKVMRKCEYNKVKGTPNEKKERQHAFRLNVWCWWWDLNPHEVALAGF